MRASERPSRRSAIVGRASGQVAEIVGVDRDVANAARASSRRDLEGRVRLPRIIILPPGVDFNSIGSRARRESSRGGRTGVQTVMAAIVMVRFCVVGCVLRVQRWHAGGGGRG